MDDSKRNLKGQAEPQHTAIETAAMFLSTLFDESDIVLFRPIESWIEDGKKRSRVVYKSVMYSSIGPTKITPVLQLQFELAKTEHTNVFFGVCPRYGDGGRFDLVWQIRTVRALWCDIDNVSVAEALDRVAKAGLPPPSIVVNSGNGVHLYWLLQTPFVIDDAGDPPPVCTEWIEANNGKKRPRKYIQDTSSDERLYLDIRTNIPELSPSAVFIQDFNAGVAALIGGDHTHDLSRILRVPGTLNRKDERNGRAPVPCQLVRCDRNVRYALDTFAEFAGRSPQQTQRQAIATVQLPAAKNRTPTRRDKLNELVTACAAAPVGARSEADWHLTCTAVEKGWPKAEVWAAVSSVGKFAEGGKAYFERTWGKSEEQTREQLFQRARGHYGQGCMNSSDTDDDEGTGDAGLVVSIAQLILDEDHFAQDLGGNLYRYHGRVYGPRAEAAVKAKVKRMYKKLNRLDEWSSHIANVVVEFIRVDSPLLWERPPLDVVNVKNGLLNVATRQLSEHTPDHLSTVQLPVEYDPAATCPKIDKFVAQVFPADAVQLAYEIPAWLMLPDTSIQMAVLLIGTGGNGKSRYLRMSEAFLGKANVSNLSLHRIESDKFACARLYGKLANICPDLPSEHLAGTSMFKAITGGDPIVGEYKFRDSFDFVPFARLVFSANSPPQAHDSSEGFFDRWLVVPFDRRFRGAGDEIPADKLDAVLSEASEQSGLLNRALEALPRLRSTGRFIDADSVSDAFSEFHAATDPLTVWLDGQTVEGPRLVTPKNALVAAFNRHCEQSGKAPITGRQFGLAVKRLRPNVNDGQRTICGKRQWCYLGIGLKCDIPHSREGDADLPIPPELNDSSRDARDARDKPSINLSHARENTEPNSVSACAVEQDRDYRVHRVQPENGECLHEFVDEVVGDRIKTSCQLCGKFQG